VRSHRIPNVLTFPALACALALSPWAGATAGVGEAAAGVGLAFALLVVPYAVGGLGAGDVKALMALGAWLGPQTILGSTAWAAMAAGVFGLVLLGIQGDLGGYFRRWGRVLGSSLIERRLRYEAPAAGSGEAGGIPFAVAIAVGVAAQWIGGSPW